MHLDAADSADDATNTTAPEKSVVKITSLNLIDLVQEPTHPQNDGGNAKQQPVGLKLLGAGYLLAGLHKVMVHQTWVTDFAAVVESDTCTDEHKDAGDNPEEKGETAQFHKAPVAVRYHKQANGHDDVVATGDGIHFVAHGAAHEVVVHYFLLIELFLERAKLLAHVVKLLREKGYSVGNVDATIVAQKPKLAPYIEAMRNRIAEVLEVELDQVSVKATTEERLGFTGAEQGISAYAVAGIEKI